MLLGETKRREARSNFDNQEYEKLETDSNLKNIDYLIKVSFFGLDINNINTELNLSNNPSFDQIIQELNKRLIGKEVELINYNNQIEALKKLGIDTTEFVEIGSQSFRRNLSPESIKQIYQNSTEVKHKKGKLEELQNFRKTIDLKPDGFVQGYASQAMANVWNFVRIGVNPALKIGKMINNSFDNIRQKDNEQSENNDKLKQEINQLRKDNFWNLRKMKVEVDPIESSKNSKEKIKLALTKLGKWSSIAVMVMNVGYSFLPTINTISSAKDKIDFMYDTTKTVRQNPVIQQKVNDAVIGRIEYGVRDNFEEYIKNANLKDTIANSIKAQSPFELYSKVAGGSKTEEQIKEDQDTLKFLNRPLTEEEIKRVEDEENLAKINIERKSIGLKEVKSIREDKVLRGIETDKNKRKEHLNFLRQFALEYNLDTTEITLQTKKFETQSEEYKENIETNLLQDLIYKNDLKKELYSFDPKTK
jgi:hypothetical protein